MQTEVVFADLRDVFETLNIERDSPKNIRRTFCRFVDLSQKLTSAMRKDYRQLKYETWNASDFSSWNPITELLKHLRNEDQHNHQISISVHERRFYPVPPNFPYPTNIEPGQLWISEGTWNLNDQLLNEVPEGVTCYAIDPTTFLPTNHEIAPVFALSASIYFRLSQKKQLISFKQLVQPTFILLHSKHLLYSLTIMISFVLKLVTNLSSVRQHRRNASNQNNYIKS